MEEKSLVVIAQNDYYELSVEGDHRSSSSFINALSDFSTEFIRGKERYTICYESKESEDYLTPKEKKLLQHLVKFNNKICKIKHISSSI